MSDLKAPEATMSGQAARIPAMTLEEAANRMQAQGGTLTAQVTVTRKDTGKVEHHTLVFGDKPKD